MTSHVAAYFDECGGQDEHSGVIWDCDYPRCKEWVERLNRLGANAVPKPEPPPTTDLYEQLAELIDLHRWCGGRAGQTQTEHLAHAIGDHLTNLADKGQLDATINAITL